MFRPRRRTARGQSLVEMALILPFMLALAGGAADLARVYQAWMTIESATRNAAEYAAGQSADATAASTDARRIVCLESQNLPGFVAGTGANPIENCTSPSVATTFTKSTTSPGATTKYPMGTARVVVTLDFKTLVPWPMLS